MYHFLIGIFLLFSSLWQLEHLKLACLADFLLPEVLKHHPFTPLPSRTFQDRLGNVDCKGTAESLPRALTQTQLWKKDFPKLSSTIRDPAFTKRLILEEYSTTQLLLLLLLLLPVHAKRCRQQSSNALVFQRHFSAATSAACCCTKLVVHQNTYVCVSVCVSVCMYVVCCSLRSKQEKYSTLVTKPIKTLASPKPIKNLRPKLIKTYSPKSIKTSAAQNLSKLSTRYVLHTASRLGRRFTYWKRNSSKGGRKEKGKKQSSLWERDEKYILQDQTKKNNCWFQEHENWTK